MAEFSDFGDQRQAFSEVNREILNVFRIKIQSGIAKRDTRYTFQ